MAGRQFQQPTEQIHGDEREVHAQEETGPRSHRQQSRVDPAQRPRAGHGVDLHGQAAVEVTTLRARQDPDVAANCAEAGNGDAFPSTRLSRNGLNGATLFAHVGGDIGDSTSWRAGASWLDLRAEDRAYEDSDETGTPVTNAFSGDSRTWVLDAVVKWAPGGNVARRYLKVQGEYMHRRESGKLTFDEGGAGLSDAYSSEQSGWYLQSVYQFMPRWRVGVRYDTLDSGTSQIALVDSGLLSPEAFPALRSADPERISIMLDWNPSEFSRLRAQYDWDDARDEGDRDRIFRLQYLYGIGAHGAHKY